MNESLREEIINEIDLATRDNKIIESNYKQLADEILKLIEKRIDEYIKSKEWDESDPLEHWAINDIENLKKELLK